MYVPVLRKIPALSHDSTGYRCGIDPRASRGEPPNAVRITTCFCFFAFTGKLRSSDGRPGTILPSHQLCRSRALVAMEWRFFAARWGF